MPITFNRLGISFQYPDNWTLDDSDALLGHNSVTVYSPGGAFWSVAVHPSSADPAQLAAAIVETMRQEYEGLESEAAQETVADCVLTGWDLAFYCLDLTNTALVRSIQLGQNTYTIFCQADDQEFDRVRAVFQAMTTSLISGFSKN
jgi:hypothetical protein